MNQYLKKLQELKLKTKEAIVMGLIDAYALKETVVCY